MTRANDILKLLACIGVSQLAGVIGGLFTASSVRSWYPVLAKPSFNPPSWVFAPVWTALYALMGVAAWLVWRRGLTHPGVSAALVLFLVQLVLNTLWSVIFFGLRSPLGAWIEIIVLWIAILLTAIWFFRASRLAGWLMTPYLAWVTFAAVLNFAIWRLNR